MRNVERFFVGVLWNSRLLVIAAVVASLIGAIAMFVVAGKDALNVIGLVGAYLQSDGDEHALRGKIEAAESSELAQRLLLIESIDDLKERLAKVIFLILIVRYFEYALETPIQTATDLVSLAVGIALIALGIFLTKPKSLAK